MVASSLLREGARLFIGWQRLPPEIEDKMADSRHEQKVEIIAEAGVNHNGDLSIAKELIEAAAEAGADFVKFQTFSASELVAANAPMAAYQKENIGKKLSQREMLSKIELAREWHQELIDYSKDSGIEFFSTPFEASSLRFLTDLGLGLVKVPSGEITNVPFLEAVARQAERVILSTGMANIGEIEAALNVLTDNGLAEDRVTVLHCTTEYPTPMREVNLRAMLTIQQAFGVKIGYSDHTEGIEVPVAAVALGATVIEKHFTLDRNMPGPDHKASLEPDELKAMITAIRNIQVAMGNGIKRPTESEKANIPIVRKSVVARKPIKKGEILSVENLVTKRPGTGICASRFNDLVGTVATRDYNIEEQIEI